MVHIKKKKKLKKKTNPVIYCVPSTTQHMSSTEVSKSVPKFQMGVRKGYCCRKPEARPERHRICRKKNEEGHYRQRERTGKGAEV